MTVAVVRSRAVTSTGASRSRLAGYYLYGDWCTGTIWAGQRDSSATGRRCLAGIGRQISSFGEDEAGELYLVDYGGAVLRFDAAQ